MRIRHRGSEWSEEGMYGSSSRTGPVEAWEPVPDPTPSSPRSYRRSDLETMTDVVMPGYFKAVREGLPLAVNNMASDKIEYTETGGLQSVWRRREYTEANGTAMRREYKYTFRGGLPVWTTPQHATVSLPSEAVLVQEALASAKSDLWDVGTFMAEASKTASMVSTIFTRVFHTARQIRRAIRNRDPAAVGKTFAQLWMEGRYGWRPTYYDLQDAHRAYQRLGKVSEPMIRRSRQASGTSKTIETPWERLAPFPANTVEVRSLTNTRAILRAGVGVNHFTGIPVSVDPLVTAWEIVPFSFLVDWFLTIGSAIEAHSPFSRGQLAFAWSSLERVTTTAFELRWYPRPEEGWSFSPLMANCVITRTSYSRKPQQPSITLDAYPKLNLGKILDLGALVMLASDVSDKRRGRK